MKELLCFCVYVLLIMSGKKSITWNWFGKLDMMPPDGGYGDGTVGAAELEKPRETLFQESNVGGKRIVRPVVLVSVSHDSFNVKKRVNVVTAARGESGKTKALDEAKAKDDEGSGSEDTVEQNEDDEAAQERRVAVLESRVKAQKCAGLAQHRLPRPLPTYLST